MKVKEKEKLATTIKRFKEEFESRKFGDDYQMLGPWIEELALVSAVETLPKGTRPFAHMVYVANKRTTTEELASAPIGPGLKKVCDSAAEAALAIAFAKPTPGSELLLKQTLPMLFAGTMIAITLMAESGIGKLPGEEKGDLEESRFFSFELLLHMAVASEMIPDTFRVLLEACEAPEERMEPAIDMLTLIALALILETASSCGGLNKERLLEGMHGNLLQSIERTERFLDEQYADNAAAADINIALKQARLRLEDGDTESFGTAVRETLKTIGIDDNQWSDDLKRIQTYSNNLLTLLTEQRESDINRMTGFFQAG